VNTVVQQPMIVSNIPKIAHLGDVGGASHDVLLVALVAGKQCSTSETMMLEHLWERGIGHETTLPSIDGHGLSPGFG
jgi:hypothetical protein